MTEEEQKAENQRKIANMKAFLDERKRRWDAKHKGVEVATCQSKTL